MLIKRSPRTLGRLLQLWDSCMQESNDVHQAYEKLLRLLFEKCQVPPVDQGGHSSWTAGERKVSFFLQKGDAHKISKFQESSLLIYILSYYHGRPQASWDWYAGRDDERLWTDYCRRNSIKDTADRQTDLGKLAHVDWLISGWQKEAGYDPELEPSARRLFLLERRARQVERRMLLLQTALSRTLRALIPEHEGHPMGISLRRVRLGDRIVTLGQKEIYMYDMASFQEVSLSNPVLRRDENAF